MAPDGTVYVVEATAKRIGVFAADGTPHGKIGPRFGDPYMTAVDGASLWVVDTSASGSVRRISPRPLNARPEPVIERTEVVALLFNVSDMASSLDRIEQLLGEDDGEEEADSG